MDYGDGMDLSSDNRRMFEAFNLLMSVTVSCMLTLTLRVVLGTVIRSLLDLENIPFVLILSLTDAKSCSSRANSLMLILSPTDSKSCSSRANSLMLILALANAKN